MIIVATVVGSMLGTNPGKQESVEQQLLSTQVVDEFMVGHREGDRVFSQVAAMEITSSGDLIVLDAGERAITVWDAHGNETHHWGRQGEGPGEFSNPGGLAESTPVLAITDGLRVHVFEGDGTVVETLRLPGIQLALRPVIDSAGRILVLTLNFLEGELRLQRLDDDEVLWRVPAENFLEQRLFRPRSSLTALSDGRVALNLDARYAVDVIDLTSGEVVGSIERDIAPRSITSSFARRVREYLANPGSAPSGWSSVVGDPNRSALPQDAIDEIEFPATFPSILHMFRGPPGETVWVRRGLGVDDELAPPVDPPDGLAPMWDLFDGSTYDYMGAVQLPDGFIPYAGDATRLAGVQKNALDVQAVRVIRIHLAASQGKP